MTVLTYPVLPCQSSGEEDDSSSEEDDPVDDGRVPSQLSSSCGQPYYPHSDDELENWSPFT